MAEPFTIRIFVPDGDPEGVRLIDRMNWTGLGVVFRRENWADTSKRAEFARAGVYFLAGHPEEDDERSTLYIGQADSLRTRIGQQLKAKDFWHWGVAFVSTNEGLNRAHITWLEYALIKRAQSAESWRLVNGNAPQEPALSESEKADTRAFLQEILQILPLVGLTAFQARRAVARPHATSHAASTATTAPWRSAGAANESDTLVVPAQREGFERVFLGERAWFAVRIAGAMLNKIKFIAAYQTQPVSAVTHWAPVDRIEPYGDGGKYKLFFSEPAREITPIPYGDAPQGTMQGPRYTQFARLQTAKNVTKLFGP